jgi:hypothetical protein
VGEASVLKSVFFQPSKRIDVFSFDAHLKMEVRTGRDTRIADKPYKVSDFDLITDPEWATATLHVGIDRKNTAPVDVVLEIDILAVSAIKLCCRHHAIRNRKDGRTVTGNEVNPSVITGTVTTRGNTVTKS